MFTYWVKATIMRSVSNRMDSSSAKTQFQALNLFCPYRSVKTPAFWLTIMSHPGSQEKLPNHSAQKNIFRPGSKIYLR